MEPPRSKEPPMHTNLPENFRLLNPAATKDVYGVDGWSYEPVDYEGDTVFAGPFDTAELARQSARRWVDSDGALS